ncbi:MAG: methyltransferase domain-containing protein [Candidatus Diapherotrites archaeon]|nr:methyltransferase domain-containing protein [Candidatus Diapherotrites archaeon]
MNKEKNNKSPKRLIGFFSEQTQKYYKLVETQTWPYLEISGIRMHCIKDTDPEKSTKQMVAYLGKPFGKILDTCTGLGYVSTHLSKIPAVQKIHSFEVDENVIALAKQNQHSQELFSNSKIEFKQGNIFEEIQTFPDNFFDFIIHDPPSIKIASELFSEKFYFQMFRVLKSKGQGFHYTGNTGIVRGKNLKKTVLTKLKNAGFRNLELTEDIGGVIFKK